MPKRATMTERGGWFGAALVLVAVLTVLRLAVLALQPIDLFTDEAQYWLWGQSLDFGYYSKPPLIAWVIRVSVALGASDAPFWVRAPAPVLHGAAALILGAVAARLGGRRAALWTAAAYATLPFVSFGAHVISTDTVMAPFYAGALALVLRTAATRRATDGVAAGLVFGLAFLAKYAALYLVPGLVLAAVLSPAFRPGWRGAAWMAAAFALMAAPNLVWNLNHGMVTLAHTLENADWAPGGPSLSLAALAMFLASQVLVFGPLGALMLLGAPFRRLTRAEWALLALALPPLLVVSVQALLAGANANWAVTAYFAATPLVVMLAGRVWNSASLALNALVGVALMVLALAAPWPSIGERPVLERVLGRAYLSRQILALAKAEGLPVLASDRGILADLFYTGAGSGVTVWAPRRAGRAQNYYELTYPHPVAPAGPTLYIAATPPRCEGAVLQPLVTFDTAGGAYARASFAAYLLAPGCADVAD